MEYKICQYCKKKYTSKGDKRNFKQSRYCDRICTANAIRGKFNDHKIKGDTVEIYCKDKVILIDKGDLKKISMCGWHIGSGGYGLVKNKKYEGLMHHFIMGKPPKNMVTDHINRNKLDNRKCNLRIVPHYINTRNTGNHRTNTSGFKGICWCKKDKRFKAKLSVNNKTINLGQFKDIQDAVKARKEGELKYWGVNYA
jgi:hypothetical protein